MKKSISKFLLLLTILAMLCSIMSITAFAKTVIPVDGCIQVTDDKDNITWSDGTLTIKSSGRREVITNTATFTNIGSQKAKVSFHHATSGDVSACSLGTAEGDKEYTLEPGGAFTVSITIPKSTIFSKTATLTITNLKYEPIVEGATVTVAYNTLGSVKVDGNVVANNGSAAITGDNATLQAIPVSGASFVAWIDKTDGANTILSYDASYTLGANRSQISVEAVFKNDAESPYCMNSGILYSDFNTAVNAAVSASDKTVVVVSNGKLSDTQYNIPEGITILVPYSAAHTEIHTTTATDESGSQKSTLQNANVTFVTADTNGATKVNTANILNPSAALTYTLTIPAGTTVNVANNARLVVGGTLVGGSSSTTGVAGGTAGAHSNIQLDGTINVNANGVLSTCGYVLGNGTINVANGGSVYQPYVIMDHKDGHYAYGANDAKYFPFNRHGVVNIRTKMVLNTGADMYAYAVFFTQPNTLCKAQYNVTNVHFVGTGDDNALFRVNSGNMTLKYDASKVVNVTSSSSNNSNGYYNKIGRTIMENNGNVTLGSISLTLSVAGNSADMSTSTSIFPLSYNYNIVQKSGTFTVGNDMALLPGATMTIDSGANLLVNSGKRFVIYDGLRDYATRAESVTLGGDSTGGTWPLYHYPSSADLKTAGYSSTGELYVNGTMTVKGKLGGTVQTNGTTGQIIMDASAANSASANFGVKYKKYELDLFIASFTVHGSCGKTERTLDAKVYTANMAEPMKLAVGKTYNATGNGTHTLNTYTYSVYATHDASAATTETKNDLNATITGTWQCADGFHTEVKHNCTVCGATEVSSCADTNPLDGNCDMCGAVLCEHPTKEVITGYAATCTKTGLNDGEKCSVCGAITTPQTEIPALGHAWNEGEVTQQPTCSAEGVKTFTCTVCGDTSKTEAVTKLPHTEAIDAAIDATCTVPGKTEGKHCSVCSEVIVAQTAVEALGHTGGTATCKTLAVCSRCGEPHGQLNATNHEGTASWTTQTDTQHGKTYTCCNAVEVAVENHEWANGICSECGYTCQHAEKDSVVTDPTCTAGGYTTYTCKTCKHSWTGDQTEKLPHSYEKMLAGKLKTEATCTAAAVHYVKCDNCSAEDQNNEVPVGEPLGHDYGEVKHEFSEDMTKVTASRSCDRCADEQSETVDVSYTVQIPATCSAAGIGVYTATFTSEWVTNKAFSQEVPIEKDPTAHSWIEATCTAPKTCSVCGVTEGTALGHNYNDGVVTAAPTCTDAGVKTFTCGTCNHTYTEAMTATGHTEVAIPAVAATCTTAGATAGVKCSACDAIITAPTTVAALGHTEVTVAGKEATCTEPGLTDGIKCSVCDVILRSQTAIPQTGHKWADATCTAPKTCSVCGATEGEALGHDYTNTTVVVNPTCTEDGSITYTCARTGCGEVEVKILEASGHKEQQHAAKAPTCSNIGWKAYVTCEKCNYTTYEELETLPHTPAEAVKENEVAATCTTAGSYDSVVKCSVCKAVISSTTVSVGALGHKDATVKDHKCDVCGETVSTCDDADSNNVCDICGKKLGEAELNDVVYKTLAEALTAAATMENPTIILLADVTGTVTINQEVKIQLNGKNVEILPGTGYVMDLAQDYIIVSLVKEALFNVRTMNMELNNSLAIHFWIAKEDIQQGREYFAEVTKAYYRNGVESFSSKTIGFEEWEDYNASFYRVCFSGIAAKEMTDDVTIQIFYYDDNGEKVVASNSYTKSIEDYALAMLQVYPTGKWAHLMVDMLNYGTAAQKEFKYKTDDYANAELSAEQKLQATATATVNNYRVKGDLYKTTSLMLESNIALNLYFTGITEDMYAVVEYEDFYTGENNKQTLYYDAFEKSGSNYILKIDDQVLVECRSVVTCTIYNGQHEQVGGCQESVESYLATMIEYNLDTNGLYMATMKFVDSARNAFAN